MAIATVTQTQAKTFTIDGQALKSAILAVAGSRDKADKHGPRGGINVRCSGGACAVAATDGYRLSVAMLDAPDAPSCEDTFAGPALEGLAKRLAGAVSVTVDADTWTFAGAVTSESLRALADVFPAYQSAIPDDLHATTVLVDTASWVTALAPLKRQSKTDPALAHLWLRASGSALTASQCGYEGYSRGIGTELIQGPARTITLDADYVKPILKAAGGLPIRLHVHADNQAVRFDVGQNIVHVVMPCLVNERPEPSHETTHDAPAFTQPPRAHVARPSAAIRATAPADLPPPVARVLPKGWDILPSHGPYYPRCRSCGTPPEEGDRFCAMCGTPLVPTLPERTTPNGHTPHEPEQSAGHWPGFVPVRVKYHGQNPQRIYDACPHASDVRGFHDWLKAGRCVQKGQKGIRIMVPVRSGDDEDANDRTRRIKPAYVFDIGQTAPVQPKATAAD